MPAGRPTSLTPELHEEVMRLAKAGVPKRVIADATGISKTQFHQWLRWGDPDLKPSPNEHVPSDRSIYIEFADAFARARAYAIILCEATWMKAIQSGDAAQAAHWLKTHEPGLYRDELDVRIGFGERQGEMDEWSEAIRTMHQRRQPAELEAPDSGE